MVTVGSRADQTPTYTNLNRFVGIGGPYHIADHYIHESNRGVENISPMTPTMGGLSNFDFHSPTVISGSSHTALEEHSLPPFCLFHGADDKTVPVSSSVKLCEALRNAKQRADLRVVEGVAHSDFILHLMDVNSCKHRSLMALVLDLPTQNQHPLE